MRWLSRMRNTGHGQGKSGQSGSHGGQKGRYPTRRYWSWWAPIEGCYHGSWLSSGRLSQHLRLLKQDSTRLHAVPPTVFDGHARIMMMIS